MDLIAKKMKKITKKTHGIPNLKPMDKYIKLIISQLTFLVLPCMVYATLYNWKNEFLIITKNAKVFANITKLSSINWCKQY
jgi:multidrug resistance efflux pump